jgi:hypothetical protein
LHLVDNIEQKNLNVLQVAGPFLPQFEIYWNRLDPQDTGKVSPLDAAKFLKSSGLSDQTLGKVGHRKNRNEKHLYWLLL